MRLVPVCDAIGPLLESYVDRGEFTEMVSTDCNLNEGHEELWHSWYNDEGDVNVRWQGGPPFNYGDGTWRE